MIAEIIVIMIRVCSQPQGRHTENAKDTWRILVCKETLLQLEIK